MDLFDVHNATAPEVPIIISVPHSGTYFPDELKPHYLPEKLDKLEDTDWFVDKLYDFAPALGITIIKANYHRWVIDLNRHPLSDPLYTDGRTITELCPSSTFNEEAIYYDHHMPTGKEIERRVEKYYKPYYDEIQSRLNNLKKKFDLALLWDAHSIKQYVPGIREEIFPDMILGDNDGKAATNVVISTVMEELESSRYKVAHNDPFKGGNITRYFGKPDQNQMALQLEMTKINYLGNDEIHYSPERAENVRNLLERIFKKLISILPNERL